MKLHSIQAIILKSQRLSVNADRQYKDLKNYMRIINAISEAATNEIQKLINQDQRHENDKPQHYRSSNEGPNTDFRSSPPA